MTIIDGKKESKIIKEELKTTILNNSLKPKLVVIQVGNDERSNVYIKNKERACKEIGVNFELKKYSEDSPETMIIDYIDNLNKDANIHGIILQLPIPVHLNCYKIINTINALKDVDGLTDINLGKLFSGQKCFASCTSTGIIYLLKKYNILLEGKKVVLIGRSLLVGKPLILLLLENNATVIVCHSKTNNIKEMTKQADILIVATGHKNLIQKDMIKKDCVIIDVGITSENGKIYGDVDYDNVKDEVSYIAPVPGGVGPMTIAMLLKHVVESCKEHQNER